MPTTSDQHGKQGPPLPPADHDPNTLSVKDFQGTEDPKQHQCANPV